MDICTVVSIIPLRIRETKPLIPAEFILEPGSLEEPSTLIVTNGINDFYVGEGRGHYGPDRSVIRVPVPADQLAESVVNDYIDAQYGILKPHAVPGIFWIAGRPTVDAIRSSPELQRANHAQMNWYKNLVKLADDDWQKYRQHKTISDIQRFAATFLKLKRGWLLEDEISAAMSECPSCFSKVNTRAIICAHCRYVLDQERYKAMQFAPAS